MGKIQCEACKKSCKGQAIRLQEKYFHVKCFKCKECSKQLAAGGFYTKDGAYYCQEDYQRLFGTRCYTCKKFVEGEVVTALGNTYHLTCFSCTNCNTTFSPGDKVTYNGKQYLCNVCLDKVASAATTPATGPPESPSRASSSVPDSSTRSPLRAARAPTTSTPAHPGEAAAQLHSPVSDTTDFSMEMKENLYQNGNFDNSFISSPRDLRSPQSLTSGYKSDDASDCRTLDRSSDMIFENELSVPYSDNKENEQGRHRAESESSSFRAAQHDESGVCDASYDTLDEHTDAETTDKERLSPIQNIMQYRSPSPTSTHSRSSRKSRDSTGSFGSRFEVDYGRFYNTTYMEKYTQYKRGPPMNPSGAKPKSPHYHRPDNFSYSQVRKDFIRPMKKGMVDALGDQKSYQIKKKTWDDVAPMSKREAINMAKYPDAHRPDKPRPSPIERDDWPAPPDPAAAYPELLRDHRGRRRKSTEGALSDTDGHMTSEHEEEEEEVEIPDDPKVQREIEHLKSLSDRSGAAKIHLKEIQKRRNESPVLDPRSASRTPSANHEPTYKTRYESPIFASPSRDLDYRPRLQSMDDNLSGVNIKKYRTTLPISNFPAYLTRSCSSCSTVVSCNSLGSGCSQSRLYPGPYPATLHRQEWDYEHGKNFVRKFPVPKPGYGLSSRSTTMPGRNGEYHVVRRGRDDGTRTDGSTEDLQSTDELHRGYYSDFEGEMQYDPMTGLRRGHRWRASTTSSEGFATPYMGFRRSVPSIFKTEDPPKIYPYQQLKITNYKLPPGCDRNTLERNLSKEEFESIFHMARPEFYRLAEWKRNDLKRRVDMF